MKDAPFQVSDKVTLHPYSMPPPGAKPRLKRGRVYCINHLLVEDDGVQFVELVGVEFRRLQPDRKTRNPQGQVTLYNACTFQRVGQRKEAA